MASTHARVPAEGRRQQILDVATDLFARQGFNGTTTRQIAQRAAVNEAIIFRHFPTKEDLYWAVIEYQCTALTFRTKLEDVLSDGADPRAILVKLAEGMLNRDTTLTRLLLFTALEKHDLSDRFYRMHVSGYFEQVSEFIRRNIEQGRFRPVDPLLAARGFIGMLFHHFYVQEVFGGKKYQQFDTAEVSRTLVDIWLRGIAVQGADDRAQFVSGAETHKSNGKD